MSESKIIAEDSYCGYNYIIECLDERYCWYFPTENDPSILYDSEDLAHSAARNQIDAMIIEHTLNNDDVPY